MNDNTTDPINVNEYGRLNPEFLQELSIIDQEQTSFEYTDVEDEEDMNDQEQRMPQFRLNERKNRLF
ncbi:MAG: hypothetical protein ABI761_10475 [Saprospiraceae bacterium]